MKTENKTFEQAILLAKQLTPLEKIRLMEEIIPDVEASLVTMEVSESRKKPPLRSVYGLCADLGDAPTAAEIDEVRQEFLENFPR